MEAITAINLIKMILNLSLEEVQNLYKVETKADAITNVLRLTDAPMGYIMEQTGLSNKTK